MCLDVDLLIQANEDTNVLTNRGDTGQTLDMKWIVTLFAFDPQFIVNICLRTMLNKPLVFKMKGRTSNN